MINQIHQKEILLVTKAGFFSDRLVKVSDIKSENNLTQRDHLIDACWNGNINEMLPECFNSEEDNALRIWCICDTYTFINLNFWDGEAPSEQELAINPNIFMPVKEYN